MSRTTYEPGMIYETSENHRLMTVRRNDGYVMWHMQKEPCNCIDCPRIDGRVWSRGGFYPADSAVPLMGDYVSIRQIPNEVLAELREKGYPE